MRNTVSIRGILGGALCAIFAVFFCAPIANAHVLPLGTMHSELSVRGERITLATSLSQNVNVTGYPADAQRHLYEEQFKHNFTIAQNGAPCPFTLTSYDPSFTAPRSTFYGMFVCPSPIADLESLTMHADIFREEFATFDHFATVFFNGERYTILFNQNYTNYPEDVIAQHEGSQFSYFFTVARDYVWMGMLHIFTGYDHILFLLSIVLLSRKVKKLLGIITAFTIAHSITLILASFHVVEISARIVEPAIALTIAYVAWRNIATLRKNADPATENFERWLLAFCFGLIHGLGFATALAESDIPQIFFIPSLISFNVGIEMAQLCILAVVLPLLFLADRWKHRAITLLAISASIFGLSLVWFGIRVFGGDVCSTTTSMLIAQILCK